MEEAKLRSAEVPHTERKVILDLYNSKHISFVTRCFIPIGDKIANLRNHYDTNQSKRAKSKSKKKWSKVKSKKKRTIEKLSNLEKLKGKFYFASKVELDKLREKQNASKLTAATQPIM